MPYDRQSMGDGSNGWFRCTIAGITCFIEYRDERVLSFYADYHPQVVPQAEAADITVPYREDAVRQVIAGMPDAHESFVEWQLAYDPVSRGMLRFNRLTFHGACVEFNGKAYIFTARSGTGKSTHIKLWRRYLGSPVKIVNGDKPIISIDGGSKGSSTPIIKACGSPWAGKERWQRNVQVPLGGICILNRGTDNTIRKASTQEALDDLINRIYLTSDQFEASRAMDLLDAILRYVPIYMLSCDMSEDAVRASFEGMTGECYKAWKAES